MLKGILRLYMVPVLTGMVLFPMFYLTSKSLDQALYGWFICTFTFMGLSWAQTLPDDRPDND